MDSSEIISRVGHFIDSEILIDRNKPVLIGFSGGADSVALLDILVHLGYSCIACHCNFQLRGEEASRDMDFAEETAEKFKVPFRKVLFDTADYASRKRISVEMACRELRYEWFEEQRLECCGSAVAIAHHRDDSVETVLLNLIRGTGIIGLTGIRAVNGYIVRPLLCLNRKEIELYLSFRNLAYVTDSSNKENIYVRNKIRLQLLPLLQTINPAVYEAIERTASNLHETEQIYSQAVISYIDKIARYKDDKLYISVPDLLNYIAPRTILFEILKPFGFQPVQLDDILNSATGIPGKYFESPTHSLLKDRDFFVVKKRGFENFGEFIISEQDSSLLYPIKLSISKLSRTPEYKISGDPDIAAFDADKVKFPLTIRSWKDGDRFIPFGMKGSRKLSDYFRDKKYSLYQKQEAYVLTSGSDIIWLIGERCSDKFKIDEKTRYILEIKCEK